MACNYQGKIVTNGLVLCLDAANSKSLPQYGTLLNNLVSIIDSE